MRDHWYVPFEAASWFIGLLLLPISLLWRVFKLIKQMATDS